MFPFCFNGAHGSDMSLFVYLYLSVWRFMSYRTFVIRELSSFLLETVAGDRDRGGNDSCDADGKTTETRVSRT